MLAASIDLFARKIKLISKVTVLIVMVCLTWVKNWNTVKLISAFTTLFFNNRRFNHLKTMNLQELKTYD